ncbi:MAG TPA: hypothetical protein VL463_29155 [Kofleriaceae bacterium]|nr:hypothetical protein [Kofleriaceae bacterium]
MPHADADTANAVLRAAPSPFADPVVRLDPSLEPPPDVAAIHAAVRAAIAQAIDGVMRERRAQMVLVTGDPGMGKTHQLAWLRRRAEGGYACVDIPPLKDPNAPFAHLARYLVQGLAANGMLERILWETTRRIAQAVRDEADDSGDDAIVARLDDALAGTRAGFAGAFRMLAQQDASLGALLYQRGRRLLPLSSLAADFGKVLCRVTDRDAERALVDWLRGAELADDDLALLDVKARDGEDRAFEVVRGLAICATKPIVLCLDQLESTSGLLGAEGLVRLFTALMEIYQQTPVCIVLMCQTQQWAELRRDMPQAAVERVRVLPPLAKPDPDEAIAIIASRLAPVYAEYGVEPPYASYPFAPAFAHGLVSASRPTIRQLLLECDARLAEMRRHGMISELGAPAPSLVEDTPAPDANAAFAHALASYEHAVRDRKDLGAPGFRQDALREAILELLRGMAELGVRQQGVGVGAISVPPKPKSGPRPAAIIALDAPAGAVRIALEVHSDEARGAYKVLERLRDAVDAGAADLAVLVREADAPLGEGAKRSLEVASELAARGGGVVYLDEAAAITLCAAGAMLDAASAAEVLVDDRQATRDEVLAFLATGEAAQALRPLFDRVVTPPPARASIG